MNRRLFVKYIALEVELEVEFTPFIIIFIIIISE